MVIKILRGVGLFFFKLLIGTIHRFENALKSVDPEVVLPYWDSNLDSHLGKEADKSVIWSEDILGNNHGNVDTGPYADWMLTKPIEGKYIYSTFSSSECFSEIKKFHVFQHINTSRIT